MVDTALQIVLQHWDAVFSDNLTMTLLSFVPSLLVFSDGDLATNPVLPLLSEEDKLLFAEDVNRLYRSRMRDGEMHVDPWSLKEFVVFHAVKRI